MGIKHTKHKISHTPRQTNQSWKCPVARLSYITLYIRTILGYKTSCVNESLRPPGISAQARFYGPMKGGLKIEGVVVGSHIDVVSFVSRPLSPLSMITTQHDNTETTQACLTGVSIGKNLKSSNETDVQQSQWQPLGFTSVFLRNELDFPNHLGNLCHFHGYHSW